MTNERRSEMDEAPEARNRSWGIDTVSSTATPGMTTSAKPVELREPMGVFGSSTTTPLRVMRSVVAVRAAKVTVWPSGVRDEGSSATVTG